MSVASLLRHVPPRARRAAHRRGLHEHLLRARRRAAGARGVRVASSASAPARRPRTASSRCARSSARAAAAGGRSSPSTTATASREAGGRARDRRGAALAELRARCSSSRARTSATSRSSPSTAAVGGYESLAKARAMKPRGGHRRAARVEPARPRRRVLPDGPQGELPPEADSAEADLPRRQRRRVGAGHVQGPRDHARASRTGCIEGCLITAHAIESKRVFIYIRGEYLTEFEILARRARGGARARRASSATSTIVVHRGAGAYICGEETALLESLEGKRGQPRSKPPFPAVAGPLRLADADQQRRDDRDGAARSLELGGAEYAKIGVENSTGTRVFSLSGQRRQRRQLRARARHDAARADLRPRRRHPGRPRAEGDHPRRLVGAGADRATRSTRALDFDSLGGARHVARLRRGDRDRRPLLHGAARPAGRAVLHARVVRQVHAVPRGHALDGADPAEDRGGRRDAGRARPAPRRLRPDPRQVPVPARRRGGDAGRELRRQVPRRVPGAHRRRRLPVRRRRRRSTASSRRSTSTRTARAPRRCRREHARARHAHGRRRRGPGAEGHRASSRRRCDAGIEIPVFCYEPRLGPPVGACRMCLVRGRGHAEAPGRLHADRAGRDGREDRADVARRPPRARTRRSSSSSSTTRSTARSATRAASARSRT